MFAHNVDRSLEQKKVHIKCDIRVYLNILGFHFESDRLIQVKIITKDRNGRGKLWPRPLNTGDKYGISIEKTSRL